MLELRTRFGLLPWDRRFYKVAAEVLAGASFTGTLWILVAYQEAFSGAVFGEYGLQLGQVREFLKFTAAAAIGTTVIALIFAVPAILIGGVFWPVISRRLPVTVSPSGRAAIAAFWTVAIGGVLPLYLSFGLNKSLAILGTSAPYIAGAAALLLAPWRAHTNFGSGTA